MRDLRVLAATLVLLLAACSSGPSESPASSPASTDAPASEAPTQEPTAEPTAEVDADAALDAFFALVAAPDDLSYHLDQVAEMESGGQPLISATYDLDVSGRDFAGTAEAGGSGVSVAFELVLIDDQAWVNIDNAGWTEATADAVGAEDILDVWRYVAARDDLELEGVDADGNLRFHSTTSLPYQTGSMRASGMTGEIVEQTLVITPDGVPVTLDLQIEASGTVQGQTLDVMGTTTVEFSSWGEAVTIDPPVE